MMNDTPTPEIEADRTILTAWLKKRAAQKRVAAFAAAHRGPATGAWVSPDVAATIVASLERDRAMTQARLAQGACVTIDNAARRPDSEDANGSGGASTIPRPHPIQKDLANLPAVFETLKESQIWVVWKYDSKEGKWTKPPYDPRTGRKAKNNTPSTWGTYEQAVAFFQSHAEFREYGGIGFMLLGTDYSASDLDDCRDPVTGKFDQWARELIAEAKSYAEVSPSGKGARIIGKTAPGSEKIHRQQSIKGTISKLESYRRCKRYITVTGNQIEGTPNELANIDDLMEATIARLGGNSTSSKQKCAGKSIEFPETLPKNVDVAALPLEASKLGWTTAAKVRETILKGVFDGDGFNNDRSRAVYFAVVHLVKAKIDHSMIASIIFDVRNKISDHVLDQPKPIPYALRQVRRAFDEINQALGEPNSDGDFWNRDDLNAGARTDVPPPLCGYSTYEATEEAMNNALPHDAVNVLIEMLPKVAERDAIEEERLIQLAKKLSNVGIGAIRDKIKAGRKDAIKQKQENDSGEKKPTIDLSANLVADLKVCEDTLVTSPRVEVYQRGGFIVMRGTAKGKSHDGKEVIDVQIVKHCTDSLRVTLSKVAHFTVIDRKTGDRNPDYPPREIASALIHHPEKNYSVLRGIITAPTLRSDGTLLVESGYDTASGLYFDPQGINFGLIPEADERGCGGSTARY
jgi:hypothetical protein